MIKSNTPEYKAWRDMKQRCLNPKNKAFPDYGGAGVSVCREWEASFDSFYESLGARPDGYSLDRIDPFGNYEPSNCRWAALTTQARNFRLHKSEGVGVTFSKRDGTWSAHICVSCKSHRIGSYRSFDEAVKARKDAEQKYWVEGNPLPEFGGIQKNNRSGVRGVAFSAKDSIWHAYAYAGRKKIHLGSSKEFDDAVRLRREYEYAFHGIKEKP